jgi:hypothetical protein
LHYCKGFGGYLRSERVLFWLFIVVAGFMFGFPCFEISDLEGFVDFNINFGQFFIDVLFSFLGFLSLSGEWRNGST